MVVEGCCRARRDGSPITVMPAGCGRRKSQARGGGNRDAFEMLTNLTRGVPVTPAAQGALGRPSDDVLQLQPGTFIRGDSRS